MPQQGNIKSVRRPHKGRLVLEPAIKSSSRAKSLKESSFTIQAARLFNSLPRSIRDYRTADGGTLDGFKRLLGTYIDAIPDLPRDPAGGWWPDPKDSHGRNSNSLYHWRPFLQKTQAASLKQLDLIVSSQPGAAQGDVLPEVEPVQDDQVGAQETSSGITATRPTELHGSPPATAPVTAPHSQPSPEGTADFRITGSQVKRTEQEPEIGSPESILINLGTTQAAPLPTEGGVGGGAKPGPQNSPGARQPISINGKAGTQS